MQIMKKKLSIKNKKHRSKITNAINVPDDICNPK